MTNKKYFSMIAPFALFIFVIIGCNLSTANMSSFSTSKDKEGKTPSTTFKSGETLYANSTISNNPGKVKVKTYLVADDAEGTTKGETIEGSEVTVELDGDGVSTYNLPINAALSPGKYTLNSEMIDEAGEKKDSKSASITIEKGADSEDSNSED